MFLCRLRAPHCLRAAVSSSAARCLSSTKWQCSPYIPKEVESKWQDRWQRQRGSIELDEDSSKPREKFYVLSMFPYPSGILHMGHVRVYTISDTIAHFQRMRGKKVLHPMGWDAFGLPAENAAIERGIDPASWTHDNIASMRRQMNSLGLHFDWHREVNTCSPDYYKWTQWIFTQLFKHGLAYKKKALVNWDPVDKTVLANEQVDDSGCSWRSGAKVEQKYLDQWFFKMTEYAKPLLEGLADLDWPSSVKAMQTDWIGKSEGAYFDFQLEDVGGTTVPYPPVRVFTTRADTIFGVGFLGLSPEHSLLDCPEIMERIDKRSLQEVQNSTKEKFVRGCEVPGVRALHPFTGAPIPIFITNYIIGNYGTKAVMGVPAHDKRDAKISGDYGLPCLSVVEEEGGKLVDSGQFSGLSVEEGAKAVVHYAKSHGFGGHMTQYKLRDWLISRQRYWGAPIPILYCDKCGTVPVSDEDLPVLQPPGVNLAGRGYSSQSLSEDWHRASCGRPGCCARRDIDTMDTFVDSSWYFLRYISSNNSKCAFSSDAANAWMPVDLYIGGVEHAVLHLLYARFITHFLCDIGLLKTREPFQKLLTQGMVQGKTFRHKSSGRYLTQEEQINVKENDSAIEVSFEKMSKSKCNGVDPEDIVREYGADTVRLFMLFKAPAVAHIQWDIRAIQGNHRWLHRVWKLCQDHCTASSGQRSNLSEEHRQKITSSTEKAINNVTVCLENRHAFNVAVSELMILSNQIRDTPTVLGSVEGHVALETLCIMLAPMAPHIASELWEDLKSAGGCLGLPVPLGDVLTQPWPKYVEQTHTH